MERVEQKRTFFSYRIHRRGSFNLKMAEFIRTKHELSSEETVQSSRLGMFNSQLEPITLKVRQKKKLELSHLYDLKVENTEMSEKESDNEEDEDDEEKS